MGVPYQKLVRLEIGDSVITLHGKGEVIFVEGEDDRSIRYGIFLDNNPYDYTPVFFWPHEVIKLSKDDS